MVQSAGKVSLARRLSDRTEGAALQMTGERVRWRHPGVLLAALLCSTLGAGITIYFAVRPNVFVRHNRTLRKIRQDVSSVRAVEKRVLSGDLHKVEVLSDPATCKAICEALVIDDTNQEPGAKHMCGGHILLHLETGGTTYYVHFDHGQGIYPVAKSPRRTRDFADLSPKNRRVLVDVLESHGFTKLQIGVE